MGNDQIIDQLKQLGDPSRLRLVAALSQGELTVGDMTRITGLSQPRVSRHLKLLTEAGLLRRTPDQNQVYYRLGSDPSEQTLLTAVLGLLETGREPFASDHRRLLQILAQRQELARDLLAGLGIPELSGAARAVLGQAVEQFLDSLGRRPALAVDVGAGTGSMLSLLGGGVDRAVGIDISPDMRLVARASISERSLTNCTVRDGDMYALPFDDGSVDLVTMDRVLGAADKPAQALAQALRVLKGDGNLLAVEARPGGANVDRLGRWFQQAGIERFEQRDLAGGELCLFVAGASDVQPAMTA